MTIDRQNYEEYFLLYSDGELDAQQRQAIDKFVIENPDLKAELQLFQELQVMPDNQLVFTDKKSLYRKQRKTATILLTIGYSAAAIVLLLVGYFTVNRLISDKPEVVKPALAKTWKLNESKARTGPTASTLHASSVASPTPHSSSAGDKRVPRLIGKEKDKVGASNKQENDDQVKKYPGQVNRSNESVRQIPVAVEIDIASRALTPTPYETLAEKPEVKIARPDIASLARIIIPAVNNEQMYAASDNAVETPHSENYVESKKVAIKGFLRRASSVINKTVELRNTSEISIKLGNVEVALH
ncbi:MAG: hypothetical protein H7Y03_02875 [Chitinophagaceae bacterium]|nr:hypothetical protein [Chitinophagaceae bacterium]